MATVREISDRATWERWLARAERCGLQQGWAYGEAASAQGQQVRRFLFARDGDPLGLAQILWRRYPMGLGVAMLMRGPVWLQQPDDDEARAIMGAIRSALPRTLIIWTPDDTDDRPIRCGFRRIYTGYSTIWLDLRPGLDDLRGRLDGKWRNMLCRAEETGMAVREVRGGQALDWLIETNETHRKKVGYRGPSPNFIRALGMAQPAGRRMVLVAFDNRQPIAGVIMDRHGASATYYAGCTTETGRQWRAHHRLVWEALGRLKASGATALDLGGIDTESSPGVARFKLGTGGEAITLAGSYLLPPGRQDTIPVPLYRADLPPVERRRHKKKGPHQRAALPSDPVR
ncbi:MAG: peptidoglycan bridge formation glycyltransferase FemA/FemB family protein [Geminicoccaceae bacterium]|nr:peptidoglycan bridge formation glycyltransferase FemA/FemB family protein [Geminicoccaceae bacterium]